MSPQYWSQILRLQLCARFILLHLPNFSAKSHSPYRGSAYVWNRKMSSTLRYDLPPRMQGGRGLCLFIQPSSPEHCLHWTNFRISISKRNCFETTTVLLQSQKRKYFSRKIKRPISLALLKAIIIAP